jgi:hypothetical protein
MGRAKGLKVRGKRKGNELVLDESLIFDLARIHCNRKEMSVIMGCSEDTLLRKHASIIEKGMSEGKESLRRKQWELAMKGNVQMLIWVGKQWLGQRDRQPDEVAHTLIQIQVNNEP